HSWTQITSKPDFYAVATSGDYNDLINKPSIPAAQVNADWNAVSGVAQILNKPTTFAPSAHTHAISEVTGLQTALDGKVDDSQVLTNVPAGAVFTDTVYTHPTTAGNKHIPAGGSVGQILRWSANGTAVW